MIFKETVTAGAPHPGTQPQVLCSAAGHYVGYLDEDGLPYSRETDYFADQQAAEDALKQFVDSIRRPVPDPEKLPFVRK